MPRSGISTAHAASVSIAVVASISPQRVQARRGAQYRINRKDDPRSGDHRTNPRHSDGIAAEFRLRSVTGQKSCQFAWAREGTCRSCTRPDRAGIRWRASCSSTAVIAPSKVARRPADRIKTDRRDAVLLARQGRAGELVSVTIPDARDEAIRDLSRSREDAVRARLKARQQLKAMLLRHGHRYTGRSSWTEAHERYLAKVSFAEPAQDIAIAEYRSAVREAHERVERLTESMRGQLARWRMRPTVEALMTLRGIDLIVAMILVAEIGDLTRLARPRELMGLLGLVPSEYSSGNTRRQGAITKTGNSHARRVLVEAAWNYRFPARLSAGLQRRQDGQPHTVRQIAWKAQLRLTRRYRHLSVRKLALNKISVAIARELSAFVWDIGARIRCFRRWHAWA